MEKSPIPTEHLDKIKRWLGAGAINIFGLPFAGKDTHGRELAHLLDASLLGSGDILRKSDLPPDIKAINDSGVLPPSDVFLKFFTPHLSKKEFAGKPMILSSVGRWIGEETGILQASNDAGHPIKAVVYLRLAEDLVHQRWEASRQTGDRGERADDDLHKLEIRIDEFNKKTLPVIEEYRKMGMLIEVNSDADRHEVLENILARLFVVATRDI